MAAHLLIVDDDHDLVEGLRWFLEDEGFRVSVAEDGRTALEIFRTEHPDVAILDIMLPFVDGVTLCETMRRESDIFIMMLSGRDGEIDKVRALNKGADDYLTKPFFASELGARVRALLRRARVPQAAANFQCNGLEVFLEERRVCVHGIPVMLSAMEFDLLAVLIRHPGNVLPRQRIVDLVWGDDFVGELRLVDNQIYRLREKLVAAGLSPSPIATIRGVGYAFRPQG